ncbi:LysR substrate-binding domain-containing protein [Polaromonas sp. P1(28)-8]|nr:LysR substrate-binding domain-containing protein [Polaromonas sp. P1(28)-8]
MLANQTGVVVVAADLASHLARRPGVKIRLGEGQSLPIIESVAQGSADIGIIGHFQPTDRLHVVPYRSIPLMLVMPAAHPLAGRGALSFADALEFDLITLMQGTAIRGWALAAAARIARKPKFTMQVQSYEAMRAMVQAGLGIAVMPAANILPYEDLLQVRAAAHRRLGAHAALPGVRPGCGRHSCDRGAAGASRRGLSLRGRRWQAFRKIICERSRMGPS